jgi:predicted permease
MRNTFWMGVGGICIAISVLFFEVLAPQYYLYPKIFLFAGIGCFVMAGIWVEIEARRDKKDKERLFKVLEDIKDKLTK